MADNLKRNLSGLPQWEDNVTEVNASNLNAITNKVISNSNDINTMSQAMVGLQPKTDNSLDTTSKNIPSAINELKREKFDKVTIVGNVLKFHANNVEKYSIILPSNQETDLTEINNSLATKYDNVTLEGQNLKFYVGDVLKKTITLPVGEGGSVDLSGYQTKNDSALTTINKTIVGAINEVASDTSQNSNLSIKNRNSQATLNIKTYEGSNQAIHPKVIKFDTPWNGYKYWMTYTPFPNGDDFYENPCIAVSNDLLKWETPSGLLNPIDKTEVSMRGKHYFSDAHILYRKDVDKVEVWYRRATIIPDGYKEEIFRKTSSDGINWSERELLYTSLDDTGKALSPVVFFENNKYIIYIYSSTDGKVIRFESNTGTDWIKVDEITTLVFSNYDGVVYRLWHFDIEKTDKGYEFVGCFNKNGTKNAYMFYSISSNYKNFPEPKFLMKNGKVGNFDERQIYRPCILKEKDKYYLFYSGTSYEEKWNMGLSVSEEDDIFTIIGISDNFKRNNEDYLNVEKGVKIGKHGEITNSRIKLNIPGVTDIYFELDEFTGKVFLRGAGKTNAHLQVGAIHLSKTNREYTNAPYEDGALLFDKSLPYIYVGGKKTPMQLINSTGFPQTVINNPEVGQMCWNPNTKTPLYYSHGSWQDPIKNYSTELFNPNDIPDLKNYPLGKPIINRVNKKIMYLFKVNDGFFSQDVWKSNFASGTTYRIVEDSRVYQCTKAGISGQSKPSFNSEIDSITVDGTVEWTCKGIKAQLVYADGTDA